MVLVSKIEKHGLDGMVTDMLKKGFSVTKITQECNKRMPPEDALSERALYYYIDRKKDDIFSDQESEDKIGLNKLEEKAWKLLEDAEMLLSMAKDNIEADPYLVDKSIRSANEVLKTCITLVKELKRNTGGGYVRNDQDLLKLLINFTVNFPRELKMAFIQEAEKLFDKIPELDSNTEKDVE